MIRELVYFFGVGGVHAVMHFVIIPDNIGSPQQVVCQSRTGLLTEDLIMLNSLATDKKLLLKA